MSRYCFTASRSILQGERIQLNCCHKKGQNGEKGTIPCAIALPLAPPAPPACVKVASFFQSEPITESQMNKSKDGIPTTSPPTRQPIVQKSSHRKAPRAKLAQGSLNLVCRCKSIGAGNNRRVKCRCDANPTQNCGDNLDLNSLDFKYTRKCQPQIRWSCQSVAEKSEELRNLFAKPSAQKSRVTYCECYDKLNDNVDGHCACRNRQKQRRTGDRPRRSPTPCPKTPEAREPDLSSVRDYDYANASHEPVCSLSARPTTPKPCKEPQKQQTPKQCEIPRPSSTSKLCSDLRRPSTPNMSKDLSRPCIPTLNIGPQRPTPPQTRPNLRKMVLDVVRPCSPAHTVQRKPQTASRACSPITDDSICQKPVIPNNPCRLTPSGEPRSQKKWIPRRSSATQQILMGMLMPGNERVSDQDQSDFDYSTLTTTSNSCCSSYTQTPAGSPIRGDTANMGTSCEEGGPLVWRELAREILITPVQVRYLQYTEPGCTDKQDAIKPRYCTGWTVSVR